MPGRMLDSRRSSGKLFPDADEDGKIEREVEVEMGVFYNTA